MGDENEVVGHKTFWSKERGFWHEPLRADEANELWEKCEREREQREAAMPDEDAAIRAFFDAWVRLKDFGWREAIYCPKDGSVFHAIEPGSTGKHRCVYEGEWPKGSWWVVEDGDMCPSHPALFKPIPSDQAGGDRAG